MSLRFNLATTSLAVALLFSFQAQAQEPTVEPEGASLTSPDTGASAAAQPEPDVSSGKKFDAPLREMEERIVGLKENIYATKTRLVLLKERILSNVVSEAWAIIVHQNDMGSAFSLDQVMYYMDGKKKFFMKNKDGILDNQKNIEIFSGSVVPGNHNITVEMVYTGTGSVFTYLKGYKFKITSKYSFYASQGRIVKIESVGYEKGDFTYSLEDRPAIKFLVTQYKFDKENLTKLTGEKKASDK